VADIFTKPKRSEVMSLIRSTENRATELRLIHIMREHGITGWRRGKTLRLEETGERKLEAGMEKSGFKTLRPDFVFPMRKIAVFVDGEFWHGHPTRAKIPKTRRAWWKTKIEGNKARDRMQNRVLRKNGWKVVRIWHYQLARKHLFHALRKLRRVGLLSP